MQLAFKKMTLIGAQQTLDWFSLYNSRPTAVAIKNDDGTHTISIALANALGGPFDLMPGEMIQVDTDEDSGGFPSVTCDGTGILRIWACNNFDQLPALSRPTDVSFGVDNVTIQDVVGVLSVKDAGVDKTKIATNLAGAGISGGAGSALAVELAGTSLLDFDAAGDGGKLRVTTAAQALVNGAAQKASNLSDLASAPTALSNLGFTAFAKTLIAAVDAAAALVILGFSTFVASLLAATDAAAFRTAIGNGTAATLASDTDTTLAANSDSKVATQKAVKSYADTKVSSSLYDAQSVLLAVSNDTPAALTVLAGSVVGRGTSGNAGTIVPAILQNQTAPDITGATLYTAPTANIVGRFVLGHFAMVSAIGGSSVVKCLVETAVASGVYVESCTTGINTGLVLSEERPFSFWVPAGCRYKFLKITTGAGTAAFGTNGYSYMDL